MITADGDLRDRSTSELIKDLSHQASMLVRQEIQLAKTEMAEKGRRASVGAIALTSAGIAGLLTLGALTAFLILALDGGMPNWAAALCVTLLWAVVGAALAVYGREKLREVGPPVPEKTVESVKEDMKWLRHPTS
jgi:Putative Actinobacterial Holin-X, holin superfamily III